MNHTELAVALTRLEENQDDIREKLDKLTVLMTGNGDPNKGFIVRFDRVERWFVTYTQRKNRIGIAVGTAVLSLLGSISLLVIRLVWGV